MKKLKRVATLFLSVMMFFSCLFFVGCADESTPGTYHLTHMTFEEGNETVNINLNILVNMISGYSMQLVLHEDGRAELKQKQETWRPSKEAAGRKEKTATWNSCSKTN